MHRFSSSQSPITENWRSTRTITSSYKREGLTKYFDFAIIGSGVVGFGYALEVVKHGSVPVITKVESHESNTNYAQEGVSVGCFLQILWKVICRTPLLSGLIYVTRRLSR